MSVDSITFRSALAQWPSGVGVVTTVVDGRPHGMTASSFSSVSLNPPLVSVCLGVHLPSHALVERAGVFAISFLGKGQAGIGQRFAGMRPEITDRFAGLDWAHAETGCPVLANATAWLDCRVVHAYPGGDHTIFVGEVLAASTPRVGAPLLFHSSVWSQLADPLPERIDIAIGGRLSRLRANTLAMAGFTVRATPGPMIADAFRPGGEDATLAELDQLLRAGHTAVTLVEKADASPVQVRAVLADATVRARRASLRVRLRTQRGLGLVNATVAMKSGVTGFDTTLSGRADALRTRDLVFLARQLGVSCPRLPATNPEE
ncbi:MULTISPECIES: flavin reductase [Micromonospora]|uniref:flavin reductase n=1 Tax=Micromonospora TaxID=1873 RepID=UPI0021C9D769|nr:flavin reductase [Micromonospora sp. Mcm103]